MTFRLIPPGEFTRGSAAADIATASKEARNQSQISQDQIQSEGPQHKVVLTQAVYLGVHEVTQAQYQQVMETNPSHFSSTGDGRDLVSGLDPTNHPVEMVSAGTTLRSSVRKLSQLEKLKPYYFRAGETVTLLGGTGYRLPTEGRMGVCLPRGNYYSVLEWSPLVAGRLVRHKLRHADSRGG